MTADAVRQALHNLRQRDLPRHGGRAMADVFESGQPGADALGAEVLESFSSTSGPDPDAYPSLVRMEQELVGLTADLLDGPRSVVGSVTASGAESIALAVQAARDARPDISRPTMVLPTSASAAFLLAASRLRVEPVLVDIDSHTCRADAAAMVEAIGERTVLVGVSAPSAAHGVVDPIAQIAGAAQARGIRCHVDAGIGGWLLPYLRADDPAVPPYSFGVQGVTSISVDLDKYAYTPTGISILLHRTPELRRAQFFASAVGPGLPAVTATTPRLKSGGPLAAAWAVTRFIGDAGYARLAVRVRDGVRTLLDGLAQVEQLRVLGQPDACVVAVAAADRRCDVFTVCDELASRGWHVRPQLSAGRLPANLQLCLSASAVPRVPEFLDALKASVKAAVAAGPVQLPPRLAQAVQTVDLRAFDSNAAADLLQQAGVDAGLGVALPDRMAMTHTLLDRATPPVRQALLIDLLDRQSRPRR